MNNYQVLILLLKNQDTPRIFDLVSEEEVIDAESFKSYYSDILSDNMLKRQDVLRIGLHPVQEDNTKQHQYVVICRTNDSFVTFDFGADKPVTSEEFVKDNKEFLENQPETITSVLVHQVRKMLFTRKL